MDCSMMNVQQAVFQLYLGQEQVQYYIPYRKMWCIVGATSGAGTAYPSEAPEFNPWFLVGFVLLDL